MSATRFTVADVELVREAARKLGREINAAGPYEASVAAVNQPKIVALSDLAGRLDQATRYGSIAAAPPAP